MQPQRSCADDEHQTTPTGLDFCKLSRSVEKFATVTLAVSGITIFPLAAAISTIKYA